MEVLCKHQSVPFKTLKLNQASILGAGDQLEYSVFILLMLSREFRSEIRDRRKRVADFIFS